MIKQLSSVGTILGISTRLKEYRIKSNTSMSIIANATGISLYTLYYWEKGKEPKKSGNYFRLKEYLDKMERQLNANSHEMVRLPLEYNKAVIPHYDGKAISGTVFLNKYKPELLVEQVKHPHFGETEGLIWVNGDNMEPLMPCGCRIAIVRLRNYKSLEWGKCYYVIDKNLQGYVKRIYQGSSESRIILVSDNPDKSLFPTYELSWDDIKTVLKIVSCIIKF